MKKISTVLFFLISISLLISYRRSIEKEKTLAMIKPDGVSSNYTGTIKKMILESNFSILHEMTVQLDEDSAALFYAEHSEQRFFNNLIKHMTSGPVFVMVLEKEDAIVDWRALIGPEDASKAKVSHPNSIRAMCGLDLGRNCVHGSDSPQSAAREISFFFGEVSSTNGHHEFYQMEGSIDDPSVEDDGESFSPIVVNATSVHLFVGVPFSKTVYYTLMVGFISFLQVHLLIRQMEYSNTQPGAARNSIFMIGQQAIMDAYLLPSQFRAGILLESLYRGFSMAFLSENVVFITLDTRYLLAIWKETRPVNNGEGREVIRRELSIVYIRFCWEAMRRQLLVVYSRFYGIVLGGILIMYEFHSYMRTILLIVYSFWIPQIVTNVIHDSKKPLHPHYILGMTATRLAIPLYVFGCPNNVMRVYHDQTFCICVAIFVGLQATMLLLQHYLGSRWFIPRQILQFLPEKFSYYRRFDHNTCHATDCVICLSTIDLAQRSNDCMATPCGHFFHSSCLQRWMNVKMECPTCRRPLPAA
ncbi:hypothetical protein MKX03_020909 [Papaver bracteatum]|nr:hypothetical protein MKX03_020909 [Papaver bracteatum]